MATFFNQATLSYNDNVTNSNIVTGEITEVVSAEKTALTATYTAGDSVAYLVSITNSGTIPYTNLTVTDDLGAYEVNGTTYTPLTYVADSVKYYVNGVLQATPAAVAGPPLAVSGITVPAGGNAIVAYEARVNTFAPLQATAEITNTATVSGGGITPVTATETISAANEAVLTITKSLSPEVVTENGQITYTFVIQNIGNTAATVADNAIVTDTFDPILNPIAVTYNGAVWTEGINYTYDETTGAFATIAGQITVPAATYTQDAATGEFTVTPGVSVIRVTGTV